MLYTYIFQYTNKETQKTECNGLETVSFVSNLPLYTYINGLKTLITPHKDELDNIAINNILDKHSDDDSFKLLAGYIVETNSDGASVLTCINIHRR